MYQIPRLQKEIHTPSAIVSISGFLSNSSARKICWWWKSNESIFKVILLLCSKCFPLSLSLSRERKRCYQFNLIRFSIEQFHAARFSQQKSASFCSMLAFCKCNIRGFAICNRNAEEWSATTTTNSFQFWLFWIYSSFRFIFFYWRHFIWISIADFFLLVAFVCNRIFYVFCQRFTLSFIYISFHFAFADFESQSAHSTKSIWIIKCSRTSAIWTGKNGGNKKRNAYFPQSSFSNKMPDDICIFVLLFLLASTHKKWLSTQELRSFFSSTLKLSYAIIDGGAHTPFKLCDSNESNTAEMKQSRRRRSRRKKRHS